jgi:hypothetical protein
MVARTSVGDAGSHQAVVRRGRRTSSPPQFGHVASISEAQPTQNVHSYEQMHASPAASSDVPQRSHTARISNAMPRL